MEAIAQLSRLGNTDLKGSVGSARSARIRAVTVNERQQLQAEVTWTNIGGAAGPVDIMVMLGTIDGDVYNPHYPLALYVHSSGDPGEVTHSFLTFYLEEYRLAGHNNIGTWDALVIAGTVDGSGNITDIQDQVLLADAVTITPAPTALGNIDTVVFMGL